MKTKINKTIKEVTKPRKTRVATTKSPKKDTPDDVKAQLACGAMEIIPTEGKE